jgi:polar amino acid transport system substrate-binding protein
LETKERSLVALLVTLFLVVACGRGGGERGTAATPMAEESPAEVATAPVPGGDPNDLLARIKAADVIRVATDPQFPPQSELLPDGTFEGFDIDVAEEIGARLGVDVKFETPNLGEVVAGNWAERWDIAVSSLPITKEREDVLDFTQPYYFTPAQMSATDASGITSLQGLAGKTVCVGEATTYFSWLNGELELAGGAPEPAEPPAGVKATTRSTDTDCAEAAASGRIEFEGWLSSSTTVDKAIRDGAPFVMVGDPVFFEPLAVAVDKAAPTHDELNDELERIIGEMHQEGTLSEFSKRWFDGRDLTIAEE